MSVVVKLMPYLSVRATVPNIPNSAGAVVVCGTIEAVCLISSFELLQI